MTKLRSFGWGRAIILLSAIWFIVMFFAFFTSNTNNNIVNEYEKTINQRLMKAVADIQNLKKQNNELRNLFADLNIGNLLDGKDSIDKIRAKIQRAENVINNNNMNYVNMKDEPNDDYEKLRKKIQNNVQELWYFIISELNKLKKKTVPLYPEMKNDFDKIFNLTSEQKRSLIAHLKSIAEVDGFQSWREKESFQLSDLIQRRIKYLQNPPDCSTAKKLVCSLNKGCGYGCQIHHVVYCLLVAYGTERTLILKSKGWRYNKEGWQDIFLPLSETCNDPSGTSHGTWPSDENTQVISLPIIDSVVPRPPYIPLAIPEDLAPRLLKLHSSPIVWWIGQFLKYLLRPQPHIEKFFQDSINRIGFQKPIVGVHIRRTDKVGTEAALHEVGEYMKEVEEYYNQLEYSKNLDSRRVYIASDDPKVIVEAKSKYPNYEIMGDTSVAKTAAVSTRYSNSSLYGIILDVHLLSLSDYLVCTFSSQVCRLAYEIMQTYHVDASDKFRSLDDVYYYGGQSGNNRIALVNHLAQSKEEVSLKRGDLIGIAGNHWNGYSVGKNLRTNQRGLFPSFKVQEHPQIVKFPTYPQVPLNVRNNH